MKKLLSLTRSLGIRKILSISGVAAMLILLCMGPTMLRTAAPVQIATASTKTADTDSPAVVGGNDGSAAGFDPSTFNVTPITMPDGSVTFPTYTVPPAPTYTGVGNVTGLAPDPDKCAAARAGIAAVEASYADENADLQQQVKSLQTQIIAMTTINRSQDTSPGVVYSLPDTTAMQTRLQTASNKLMSNFRDANSKKAAFQQQFNQNCWNQ